MNSKFIGKFTSLLIIMALLFSSVPYKVVASDEHKSNGKTNFRFISTDLNHTEYSYDENGESYKVIEIANSDLSVIETQIYQRKQSNNYVLFSEFTTKVQRQGDTITVTTIKDGISTVDTINLEPVNANDNVKKIKSSDLSTVTPNSDLTPWTFSTSYKGSNKITKYTLSVVVAILTHVAATELGGVGGAALVGINAIAQKIIDDTIPTVYYSKSVYYKYIRGTDPPLPRAEKDYTYFYSNSKRTDYLGSTVDEYYVPGWS